MKRKSIAFMTLLLTAALLAGCAEEDENVGTLKPIVKETEESNPGHIIVDDESDAESEENTNQGEVDKKTEETDKGNEDANVSHENMYRSELTGEWIDDSLKNQRPMAIMVDNESIALDHYGINSADVVYEIMNSTANSRITRLMCIIKDWEKIEQFGSIRSARPTNFMLAAEYNAVLIHDGGPFYIDEYVARSYTSHLSGGFARFSNGKKSEYTEYVTFNKYTNPVTGKSYDGLGERLKSGKIDTEYNSYYPGEHFTFDTDGVDLSGMSHSMEAENVELPFPLNKSRLKYEESTKTYQYYEYGKAHVDAADDKKVTTFKNVILQKCSFSELDQNGYMIYNVLGKDEGYYITEGYAIPIVWSKTKEEGLTKYVNGVTGEEIKLNTGKTYISLVPSDKWSELVIK